MSINKGPNYIFGTCKHHRVMLCSLFPSVKTLPAYRWLRRPVTPPPPPPLMTEVCINYGNGS